MADIETKCEWKICLELAKTQGERYYHDFLQCYSKKMKEDNCEKCDGKTQKICYIERRPLNSFK